MRCPKCHYISFESGDRCRNCGYEFSLAVEVQSIDLPIQTGEEPSGPLADLRLSDGEPVRANPEPGESAAARRPATPSPFDLPLFSGGDPADDRPLVTPPAVPRAPLAVRRGSPAVARPKPRAAPEPEEPALLDDPVELPRPRPIEMRPDVEQTERTDDSPDHLTAPLVRRTIAGLIDLVIVAGIDAAVVYFTLRLCGIGVEEITLIPPVPFLTFLLLLNGGYWAGFVAAGGQTIGKMAMGIRVVPFAIDAGPRVSFGYAVLRATAYLVSVLPLGLGLVPAFFSAERRTLHDRLADTRVVRASASGRE